MDQLVRLVAAIRQRIDEHGAALRASEALTRYALIDPWLRCLGWDTADPAQVVAEYRVPSGRGRTADYALFARPAQGEPAVPDVIVEAKKLGSPLTEAAQQAVHYCTVDGFEHFVVTDGKEWQLFGTLRRGNLDAKRITRFDLCADATADVCRKALALWRWGFEEGVVEAAPAVGPGTRKPSAVGSTSETTSVPVTRGTRQPSSAQPEHTGWVSLRALAPERGTKPIEVRMPSGDIVQVTSWRRLMAAIAAWLVEAGKLSAASEPLRAGGKYVLARSAEHPDGRSFRSPLEAGPLYVETHHSARGIARHSRAMIEHAGLDPAGFSVRVA